MSPRYALARVNAAGAERAVHLDGARCLDMLMPFLGEFMRCHDFASAVAERLAAEDYCDSVRVGKFDYDEYGMRVPVDVLDRFGVDGTALETVYVKLRVSERGGDTVYFLSLHPAERPLYRVGGRIDPADGD